MRGSTSGLTTSVVARIEAPQKRKENLSLMKILTSLHLSFLAWFQPGSCNPHLETNRGATAEEWDNV